MKQNPISKFDEKGLISDIVEDVNVSNNEASKDFIEKAIDKKMKDLKIPQYFRDTFDILMINQGTKLHEYSATAMKYSDLLARYTLYKYMVKENTRSETEIFDILDKAFINYTPQDHHILKYLNDIGFMRFTKYWMRIQQYLSSEMLTKKLATTLVAKGTTLALGIDLPTPLDAFLGYKLYNRYGTFNIPLYGDYKDIKKAGYMVVNPLTVLNKIYA